MGRHPPVSSASTPVPKRSTSDDCQAPDFIEAGSTKSARPFETRQKAPPKRGLSQPCGPPKKEEETQPTPKHYHRNGCPRRPGNVIQLRCKPTSRQFSVRPSARKSPAGAGLVAGHACRLAGPRRTHGARQARHTKTPCPQRGQDSVANGWAAGDGRRIERYANCRWRA
jgi:hypothetical protein